MRFEREVMLSLVRRRLEQSSYIYLMDFSGTTVSDLSVLREALQPHAAEFRVVKNSFLKLAASQLGWADLYDILVGPTAMITGGTDVVEIAKTLANYVKNQKKTEIKGGCLEGKALSSADVGALAKLPSREVMLGMFVGTVAAPMTQLVGVMNQKLLSLLYALKAVEAKKQAAA